MAQSATSLGMPPTTNTIPMLRYLPTSRGTAETGMLSPKGLDPGVTLVVSLLTMSTARAPAAAALAACQRAEETVFFACRGAGHVKRTLRACTSKAHLVAKEAVASPNDDQAAVEQALWVGQRGASQEGRCHHNVQLQPNQGDVAAKVGAH